jgi:hypothetical protein
MTTIMTLVRKKLVRECPGSRARRSSAKMQPTTSSNSSKATDDGDRVLRKESISMYSR